MYVLRYTVHCMYCVNTYNCTNNVKRTNRNEDLHCAVQKYSVYMQDNSKPYHTLIKKKINFSSYTYKEIQSGAVAKSYMTNGLLIYREIFTHFLIY